MKLPLVRFLSLAFVASTVAVAATDAPRPWPADSFLPVTWERIVALPAAEQTAWRSYWQKSRERSALLPARNLAESSPTKPLAGPPILATYSEGLRLDEPAAWYGTEEARTIADHLVQWQTPPGGWTKGGVYSRDPLPSDDHHNQWSGGTFDNDSTIPELRFLGRVCRAVGEKGDSTPRLSFWRASFLRGLNYIFDAQYPNGGFPQIYPLAGSYHDAITFNDDAMLHVLELLRDIAAGQPEYAFLPADKITQARERLDAGIRCILACQLPGSDGRPTIWGQQHDALTLKPCAARNFEPASECSHESTGLVRFLMGIPRPCPEIIAAVDGAMEWYDRRAIHGSIWDRQSPAGTGLGKKKGSPALWARFYEFGTGRPIFGERDRTIHYDVSELSLERRNGYGWYMVSPGDLLPLHAAWKKSLDGMK